MKTKKKQKLERVHLRLTIEEKEKMLLEAEKLDLTLSEYIRLRALNKSKPYSRRSKQTNETRPVYKLESKIRKI